MKEKTNYDVVARQKYFNNHFIVTAHIGIDDRCGSAPYPPPPPPPPPQPTQKRGEKRHI
jgi:hypothetical protein